MKHTPEPWAQVPKRGSAHIWNEATGIVVAGFGGMTQGQERANLQRTVACVNALAGVPDPAAFVNETLGLLDAARHELSLWLDYRQDDQDTARVVDEITEFLATVNR